MGSATARGAGNGAEAIVLSALVGVAQHIVGFVELLEAVFRVRLLVHIRVKLASLLAESLLDLIVACRLVDAKNLVQIVCHRLQISFSGLQIFQNVSGSANGLEHLGIVHARRPNDQDKTAVLRLAETVSDKGNA